jgi:N-acetylneuraminate synthase/N,N'-diacetyllegionaminate synthase
MLVSTGMSTLDEVEAACSAIADAGAPPVLLFHCVSQYPAPIGESNVRAIPAMRDALGVPVGYSDHTPGIEAALAAIALGACALEKHLTLDRTMVGPDHRASLEPAAFAQLVIAVRAVESALGDGRKRPMPSEASMIRVARRSLVAAARIAAGERLSEDMVTAKRPGTGLPTAVLPRLLGRRARSDIGPDTLLTFEMFE